MKATRFVRATWALPLVGGLLLAAPFRELALAQEGSVSQRPTESQVERIKLASGHHGLALLYLKKGDVDRAVAEARKILELEFPADQEQLVASSMVIIAEKLGVLRKFDAAQALLDDALKSLESSAARQSAMLGKAKLYVLAGDDDRAIDSYKKAFEISRRSR